MRYVPSPRELENVSQMTSQQRLQYFLSRVFEVEEVWGLADNQGWIIQEEGEKVLLRIWPYREFAEACRFESDLRTQAISLDHFYEHTLEMLIDRNICLDILSIPDAQGSIIDASELQGIFNSLMDSGEYFLEG